MRKRVVSMILAVVWLLYLFPQFTQVCALNDGQKQELAETVAKQIVAGMPSWVDTDEEKVLYLYDYITDTVTYEDNPDDQTAYGSLVKGKCVCAGYARGFELLLNTAGIEAGSDIGKSYVTREGHQWNYLYLGGQKLYADTTWGDRDFVWSQIDGNPAKQNHYNMIQTEKQIRNSHAEYIFLDGVYDGSGEGSENGSEYTYAAILERSGVPVGRFNRETKPEEVLPYFQVIYYDGSNALIRAVYYYDEVENDHHHVFAAGRAAQMLLDSITESYEIIGPECEVYYWGPIANYTPTPAQSIVLRTGGEREIRKGEVMIVTAEVLPLQASNKRVIYSSSNQSIATVDSYGKVTGISEGTVTIAATSVDGSYTDSIEITVISDHYHDSWLKNIFEKEPTCEQPGHKMYFLCQSCGAWFPDYWGSAEIKDHESWTISALGHEESSWLYDKDGHWKQCNRNGCGKILQEKTKHSDGNGDGLCDACGLQLGKPKPIDPTTVPTETTGGTESTTEPTTVPTEPTGATEPTTAPPESTAATEPSTVPKGSTDSDMTRPDQGATADTPLATDVALDGADLPQGAMWVIAVALVSLVTGMIILLLRKKRE